MWTITILIGAFFQILMTTYLITFVMLTWVIFIYVGFLTWLALLIYLPLKKRFGHKLMISLRKKYIMPVWEIGKGKIKVDLPNY